MVSRRIVSVALALGLLLSTIGPAFAAPADGSTSDQLPPGLSKKVFIHDDRELAKGVAGPQSSAEAEDDAETACTISGAPSPDCPTFVFNGTHWNPGTLVTYYVNMNFRLKTSLSQTTAKQAIDASFQAWQAKMPLAGGITFLNRGSTKLAPGKYDGRNVVGWGSLSSGYLAITTIWYYSSTGQIVETDIAFNNLYKWAYTAPSSCDASAIGCNPPAAGPAGTYDLRNIGTHEAGHTLMLGDLYDPSNSALTMYGYGGVNERSKDSLGQGDILGIDAAY